MREGWTYKKLGEVCDVINGLWTGKKEPFITVGVIRNANFTKECTLNLDNVAYIDVEEKQFKTRELQYGDIIIEKSGGSDNQPVGRPIFFYLKEKGYSFSNFTAALRIKELDDIIPPYLHKALLFQYKQGITRKLQSKTTGLHNLNFKAYLNCEIPLPPKSQQEAIVSELDEINSLLALKREQLQKYDKLAQSLFSEMFGDPIENEKGWEVKKIGEVCETTSGGTPSSKKKEYYEGGNIPWLRSGEVSQGLITKTELYITQEGYDNSSAKYVPVNSVAIAMYGATVGQVGIIKAKMCTNQAVCSIFPSEKLEAFYLMYFLQKMKPYYLKNAIGGAQANISQGIIKATNLPLPPLPLQQQFASRIEQIESQKQQVQDAIEKLETLLASRMQYWFD